MLLVISGVAGGDGKITANREVVGWEKKRFDVELVVWRPRDEDAKGGGLECVLEEKHLLIQISWTVESFGCKNTPKQNGLSVLFKKKNCQYHLTWAELLVF